MKCIAAPHFERFAGVCLLSPPFLSEVRWAPRTALRLHRPKRINAARRELLDLLSAISTGYEIIGSDRICIWKPTICLGSEIGNSKSTGPKRFQSTFDSRGFVCLFVWWHLFAPLVSVPPSPGEVWNQIGGVVDIKAFQFWVEFQFLSFFNIKDTSALLNRSKGHRLFLLHPLSPLPRDEEWEIWIGGLMVVSTFRSFSGAFSYWFSGLSGAFSYCFSGAFLVDSK